MLALDEVEVAGKAGDEEAGVVAPDLGAADQFEEVVDLVQAVEGGAIAVGLEAVVANEVEVGQHGELFGRLPGNRDVVEIAQGGVGVAVAGSLDGRGVGVLGADVGGGEDGEVAVEQVEAEATVEGDAGVVVAGIEAAAAERGI